MGICEFQASLVYIVSSRTARDNLVRSCLEKPEARGCSSAEERLSSVHWVLVPIPSAGVKEKERGPEREEKGGGGRKENAGAPVGTRTVLSTYL